MEKLVKDLFLKKDTRRRGVYERLLPNKEQIILLLCKLSRGKKKIKSAPFHFETNVILITN